MVRRALPAAARDGVRRPALVLPPLRRRSPTTRPAPPRERIWETHQRAQPAPRTSCPTRGRATLVLVQGRGPQRPPGAAPQALRQPVCRVAATRHPGVPAGPEPAGLSDERQQRQTRTEHDSMGEVAGARRRAVGGADRPGRRELPDLGAARPRRRRARPGPAQGRRRPRSTPTLGRAGRRPGRRDRGGRRAGRRRRARRAVPDRRLPDRLGHLAPT